VSGSPFTATINALIGAYANADQGDVAVSIAVDAARGYWNTGAFIQALNLGIIRGAVASLTRT
jgi:hypothetical protein